MAMTETSPGGETACETDAIIRRMILNVEEALRRLEARAAMLRFLADSAAASTNGSVPEPAMFSGLADTLEEIQRLACSARRSLGVEALGTELKRQRMTGSIAP